jgi:hypothetical protein
VSRGCHLHHRTPSVSLVRRWFAPPNRTPDNAVFRRESFARGQLVELGFRPALNPPRLSTGRASRIATGSDVPCRANGWSRFPHLGPRRTPRRAWLATRTRTAPSARPLRLTELTIQNAFDWIDPNLSAGNDYRDDQRSPTVPVAGTPLSRSHSRPPVTVWAAVLPLPSVVPAAPKRRLPMEARHL